MPLKLRHLAFEACEPRFVLSALPVLIPTDDPWMPDEPAWAEVAEDWKELPSDTASSEETAEPAAEPISSERPETPAGEEAEWSEEPVWIMLESGPAERALASVLDSPASPQDSTLDESSSEQPFPLEFDPDVTAHVAAQPAAGRDAVNGQSVTAGAQQGHSKLELERPRWTAMTTVRYPLYNAGGPRTAENRAIEPRVATSTPEFLDVGQFSTSPTPSLRTSPLPFGVVDPAFAERTPVGSADKLIATNPSAERARAERVHADRADRQASLTGQNAGYRLLLLASAHSSGSETRASSSPEPAADGALKETSAHNAEGERPRASRESAEDLDASQARVWPPRGPTRDTRPVTEDRVSRRVTMGAVVYATLATGLVTAACRARRERAREVRPRSSLHAPTHSARDIVFGEP